MAKIPKTKKRKVMEESNGDQQQEAIDNTTNKESKTIEQEKPQTSTPTPQSQQKETPNFNSGSDSDCESDSLPKLLEPYSKDQLLDLISSVAQGAPALLRHIRHVADRDVSHRKIFVHGLGWDTTRQTLLSAFEPFGEIEDCTLVTDKTTGKAKGYGFVLFKARKSTKEALRDPKKKIGNRVASCQLASAGPGSSPDGAARTIYVSHVLPDSDAGRLRQFFAKFGEIETGPSGFDSNTGKFRGFAFFVYKGEAGAKKALEEPNKMFEGQRLHCQRANEGKGKNPVQAQSQTQTQPPLLPQGPPPFLAAAAQNMTMFGQHPFYGGFIANPGVLNPALVAGGMLPTSQSVLGAYGGSGTGTVTGMLNVYPNSQMGPPSGGFGGPVSGYPSYMWYDIFQLDFAYVIVIIFIVFSFAFSGILVLIFGDSMMTNCLEAKHYSSYVICALLFNWFCRCEDFFLPIWFLRSWKCDLTLVDCCEN